MEHRGQCESVRAICTHTKGFDLCQNELSLCLGPDPPRLTHRPPFSPPLAFYVRRVAGLTRIIFTAYHRLNIDLRMVSSSV